eukprot:6181957-Pleurochrysis_carterae.AAC.3
MRVRRGRRVASCHRSERPLMTLFGRHFAATSYAAGGVSKSAVHHAGLRLSMAACPRGQPLASSAVHPCLARGSQSTPSLMCPPLLTLLRPLVVTADAAVKGRRQGDAQDRARYVGQRGGGGRQGRQRGEGGRIVIEKARIRESNGEAPAASLLRVCCESAETVLRGCCAASVQGVC